MMDIAIRRRLAKLSLLLSSNQPGEVTAAAAAIARALSAAGLDWHDLAKAIHEKSPRRKRDDRALQSMPSGLVLAKMLLDNAKAENAKLNVRIKFLQARVSELEKRYESRPIARVIYADEFAQPRHAGRGAP